MLLKDEQGKEEETRLSPHCKLKAAWMQYVLLLLSNKEQEFLHLLDISEHQNKIQSPECFSPFSFILSSFQVHNFFVNHKDKGKPCSDEGKPCSICLA